MLLNEKQAFSAVSEKAYAKLNISLDVTAKRDDGYHEMLMIMQDHTRAGRRRSRNVRPALCAG